MKKIFEKIKQCFNDLRYTRKYLFFILENQYTIILCLKALARNYHCGSDVRQYLYFLDQNLKALDTAKYEMREKFKDDIL